MERVIACVIVFILIFMYVLVNFDQINRLKSTSVTFQVNGALGLIAQAIFDSRSDKTIFIFIMQIGQFEFVSGLAKVVEVKC